MIGRRAFLAVLGAAFIAPRATFASGRGRLPRSYYPLDAHPYIHPDDLQPKHVDPLIWPAVRRINQSGWVWTLESCQGGHNWGDPSGPLIRICCRYGDSARMLSLLHRSALIAENSRDPLLPGVPNKVEVYRHVRPGLAGWFEARTRVVGPEALAVFERFANAVCEGHIDRRVADGGSDS